MEARARGLKPQDYWEELMELIVLKKRLEEAEVARFIEVG
jgi:hypothetical protein